MTKKRRRERGRAQQRLRPERQQDARLTAEQVSAIDGADVKGIWAVAMSPLDLPDGRPIAFHSPQPVAFGIVEAQRSVRRGVKERRAVLGGLHRREGDERFAAANPSRLLDCVGDLASGVLFAFTAIESFANHSIDQLPETAALTLTRRDKSERVVTKGDMVRDLGIVEKLDKAVPLLTGRPSAKGGKAWHRFVHLKRLRDDLVHVKDRGYSNDPASPSVYGRLILGEGDACVAEAAALICELRPEFLPQHVLEALQLSRDS